MNQLLTVEGLSVFIGGRQILAAQNFTLASGELLLITGANGSGKSTLLDCVAQVRLPSHGLARLHLGLRTDEDQATLGYVPSKGTLPQGISIGELMALTATLKGVTCNVSEVIEVWALSSLCRKRIEELSLGQRQRVLLAMAHLGDPQIVLLDEPTVGLDEAGLQVLTRHIRNRPAHRAYLVATHEIAWSRTLGPQQTRCLVA
jgi:ABC-type multidrug transport system ATPase subunit